MFRDWQGTQTQSSVKATSGRRQHMDVWYCVWQEPRREAHMRAASSALLRLKRSSVARVRRIVFALDKDLSWMSANHRSEKDPVRPHRWFARYTSRFPSASHNAVWG